MGLAAFGVVWGLVRGNLAGLGLAEVVAAFAAGVVCAAAFVAWERRVADPMLPLRFFRSRAFAAGNAAVFFAVASLFGAVFFLAQFLQTGLGYGPLDAGLRLLPWTLTLFFVAPLAGALVDRYGERPFMVGGLLLQGIGMGWIALIAAPDMAYASMIAPLIIAGCGVSMTFPAGQNSVVGAVPPRRWARPRAPTRCCASSGACSGSRCWWRCSPATAATRRRPRSWTASRPRWRSPPRSRSWARWSGSRYPGAPPSEASLRRSRGRGCRRLRDRSPRDEHVLGGP